MIAHKLILPMLATLALNAYAQAPEVKQAPTMNNYAETYRHRTLDENPDLTPEEIGRRILKLIDSLKSFDELSLERIRGVMRLPMYPVPKTSSHIFDMNLPGSDWYYVLSHYDDPELHTSKNVSYQFLNEDESADMAPVCAMDYDAYVTALRSMGFQEREDLAQYDALHPYPRRNERTGRLEEPSLQFRRLPAYFFTRKSIKVQILRRREADAPDGKLYHACVESIGVSRYSKE